MYHVYLQPLVIKHLSSRHTFNCLVIRVLGRHSLAALRSVDDDGHGGDLLLMMGVLACQINCLTASLALWKLPGPLLSVTGFVPGVLTRVM